MSKTRCLAKRKPPPARKVRKHSLSFLSWNVHDIRLSDDGLKTNLQEFNGIISNRDIVLLQETKEPVKMSNYRCFNSNRPSSRSGGVCIAVKNEISKGVSTYNTSCCHDIVAIKLRKCHFAMSRDIVIINIYDSPVNSSYKMNNKDEKTTLDYVADIITKLPANTGYYLMGDFNARTGALPECESPHFDPRSDHDLRHFSAVTYLFAARRMLRQTLTVDPSLSS